MAIVRIKRWNGRLGNNIAQVSNALLVAFKYDCCVRLPFHRYFRSRKIILENAEVSRDEVLSESEFFDLGEFPDIDRPFILKVTPLVLEKLNQLVTFSDYGKCAIDDNVLTVHIRSGDVFNRRLAHHRYVPPPLDYYVRLIEGIDPSRIILLAEDRKNPCVDLLLNQFPMASHEKSSLKKDIDILLSSPNVIGGFGTFVPSLLSVSRRVRHVYHPSYCEFTGSSLLGYRPGVVLSSVDLSEYYGLMGGWQFAPEQVDLLLNYKLSDEPLFELGSGGASKSQIFNR